MVIKRVEIGRVFMVPPPKKHHPIHFNAVRICHIRSQAAHLACALAPPPDNAKMQNPPPQPYRIAVVEDDHHLRNDLLDFLTWQGFEAVGCESAEAFEAMYPRRPVDLVLLDIGLPGKSGLALLTTLRKQNASLGVVLLTSFDTDEVRIQGLTEGADAYLVKNSTLELIAATCHSVLRRLPKAPAAAASLLPAAPNGWHLDAGRARLRTPDGEELELTHMETVFLSRLMSVAGTPVTRDALLTELCRPNTYNNLRNLDNCAARLRRKVHSLTGLQLPVRACYGQGYAFGEHARVGVVAGR